jgi:two-component system, OmpR family, sensor histidine kinase CreC
MSARSSLFLALATAYLVVVGLLLWRLVGDIDPRYRESAEESLVETAHLMASLVEQTSPDGQTIDVDLLDPLFRSVYARNVDATIFGFDKASVELRLYVVDHKGIVLFDSLDRRVGEDFSQWRDVRLTLQGQYGARTSPDIDGNPATSVMYVGAPIRLGPGIAGVVTAGKPVQSLEQFITAARRKTLVVGLTSALTALSIVALVAVWLARPLVRDYLRFHSAGRGAGGGTGTSPSLRRRLQRALGTVRAAVQDWRDAIAGRDPVTDYVQTLTHELKSPLAAIRGASELMQEPSMPAADRARFAANIERETLRMQETVDRMMELVQLESLRTLPKREAVDLQPLLAELVASARVASPQLHFTADIDRQASVMGDAFLLRRAVGNLIDNAREFSPAGGTVHVLLRIDPRTATVEVHDQGPGVPEYARGKVFDRFYSLPRPGSNKKSTGLGLPFVKEAVQLHDGQVMLAAGASGVGTVARVVLPRWG